MRQVARKLAFVHRTLWQRDRAYRVAMLLGPPPLVGCTLAALVWLGITGFARQPAVPDDRFPWAKSPGRMAVAEDQPYAEAPTAPLPAQLLHGAYAGLQTGWQGTVRPLKLDASLRAVVVPSVMSAFALDATTLSVARIIDAGPPSGLYVGALTADLAVRQAGLYALSMRLQRSAAQSASCLIRFFTDRHQLVSNLRLNLNGDTDVAYPPTEFRLQPGLYRLRTVFGCWRGDQVVGPGELTVLIRHPGELVLQPAQAGELVRPAQAPER